MSTMTLEAFLFLFCFLKQEKKWPNLFLNAEKKVLQFKRRYYWLYKTITMVSPVKADESLPAGGIMSRAEGD